MEGSGKMNVVRYNALRPYFTLTVSLPLAVVVITEKKEKPSVVLLPVAFQGLENCARKKVSSCKYS